MKKSRQPRKGSSDTPPSKPTDSAAPLVARLLSSLESLSSLISSFNESHGFVSVPSDIERWDCYSDWLVNDNEVYEKVVLAGGAVDTGPPAGPETLSQLLSSIDIYHAFALPWRIRYSEKAISRFKESSEDRKQRLVERILELAQGKMDFGRRAVVVDCGPMRHMVTCFSQVSKEDLVVFALEVNRVPVLNDQRLTQFAFTHFVRIVDVVNCGDKVQAALKQYLNLLRADPAKDVRPYEEEKSEGKVVSIENSTEVIGKGCFGPKTIGSELIPKSEVAQYSFHAAAQRWVHSSQRVKELWEDAQLTRSNASLISELADSQSCQLFIKFLQSRIKSFPFQLSEKELDVIGTPGNVLAIGRSGTGKTTCAMLRLLASQALFRSRLRQVGRADGGFFGLHSVFITASPTLTIEVKRFYESLVGKLAGKAETAPQGGRPDEDESDLNEKDLKIKSSMRLMTHSDFPLFSTTRLLVFAIDASLRRPFFKVTEEGEGTAVQAGFHNELKGVRVISHNLKKEEIDDNYDFQSQSAYRTFDESLPGEPEEAKKDDLLQDEASFEVDFDHFERHFWPTVKSKNSLSAALVWAEISGKLKGSAASCTYSGGHIPKEVYQTQHKKTSLLTAGEKEAVWAVFQQYERWKAHQRAYDFQDVVTHALKEIALSGYEGTPVHFMMVDEVQDLTHSTLLLLARVTEQNMFFSGDTAQTIAKGVSFRFKDLSTLFASHEGLAIQPPTIQQLLINYRSHNRVLNLANCVVRLIELLFPKTIDKLERESSVHEGENLTPIVLMNPCLDEIVNALVVGESVHQGSVIYGSGQVVLVADEIARSRLPEILKGALCLTIYESKGLEFDDVILFEFFENCGVTEDQWRLLREVLYEDRLAKPADIYSPAWKPKFLATFDSAKHAAMCTALKMLYVAITRTKRKFIVYDSSAASKHLLDYMVAVGMVTPTVPQESGLATNIEHVIQSEAGKVLWRNLGIKMMKMKYYAQAAKCFLYASDDKLRRKAEALHIADESSKVLQAAEAILSDKSSDLVSKQEAETQVAAAVAKFAEVAKMFFELGQMKYAAQCFFSARLYGQAANIYKKLGLWNELGNCLFCAKNYEDAGKSYERAQNYQQALRAYDQGQLWVKCVNMLYRIKGNIPLKKRVALIRKYALCLAEMFRSEEETDIAPLIQKPKTQTCGVASVSLASEITFSRPKLGPPLPITSKEKQQLLRSFYSENQMIPFTTETLIAIEQEIAASEMENKFAYSYLSIEDEEHRPSGSLVVSASAASDDSIDILLKMATMFESDAVQLERERKQYKRLTGLIQGLTGHALVSEAIAIMEVFQLRPLAFTLANAHDVESTVSEYVEWLAVCSTGVQEISASDRFADRFRKLGNYHSLIAAKQLHTALEVVKIGTVKKLADAQDTLHSGLIFLGFWKKVVALSPYAMLVAASFGDFQHVKLMQLRNTDLPRIRKKELLENSSTWPTNRDTADDIEVMLCLLEESITTANSYLPITRNMKPILPAKVNFQREFRRNQAFWNFILNKGELKNLEDKLENLWEEMNDAAFENHLQSDILKLSDIFSFFVQLIFSYQLPVLKRMLSTLSFEHFEQLLLTCKLWLNLFSPSERGQVYMPGYYYRLRATLAPFGIRLMRNHPFLAGLPIYTHALLSSDCLFFSELVQKRIELLSIDIEGNVFLAPISDLFAYVRLTVVRFLTEMVSDRKELFKSSRQEKVLPFRTTIMLFNEQLRARAAACIYGEICHLRTIQRGFPNEYRFVGRHIGTLQQSELAKKISSLRMEISELSGEDYEHDDPLFTKHLLKKNKALIKAKTDSKNELLSKMIKLSGESQHEDELTEFLESLPIAIHHEMMWVFEHSIPLTQLASLHLMAYLKDQMSDFDYEKDIPKLRLLDNVARLCHCQPFLASLVREKKLNSLLFPEEEYAAGNFLEMISRNLNMIRYPFDEALIAIHNVKYKMLRKGLDMKEKFLLIQKCVMWSLVLTRHRMVLPSLFAVQLTRYQGHGLKVFQKQILEVDTNISICKCLHLLCDMIEVLQPEDQIESISHTVLLITASVIANTSWTVPFFAFSEVVRRLFYCIQNSPLDSNKKLHTVAELPVAKLGILAEKLRRNRCLVPSVLALEAELVGLPTEEKPTMFIRDTHSEEDEGVMLVKVTDEELQEAEQPAGYQPEAKRKWYEGKDMELVVQNDYLDMTESEKRKQRYRRETQRASQPSPGIDKGELREEALPWITARGVEKEEDQLLFADIQREFPYVDVFLDCSRHFRDALHVIHALKDGVLKQIQLFHCSRAMQERTNIYRSVKLLVKTDIRLRHCVVNAILKCRKTHEFEGDEETLTVEELDVNDLAEDARRALRQVERTDVNEAGGELVFDAKWLEEMKERENAEWKRTKQ